MIFFTVRHFAMYRDSSWLLQFAVSANKLYKFRLGLKLFPELPTRCLTLGPAPGPAVFIDAEVNDQVSNVNSMVA